MVSLCVFVFFFFQAEDGIRDDLVTGVQTCALPISRFAREGDDTFGAGLPFLGVPGFSGAPVSWAMGNAQRQGSLARAQRAALPPASRLHPATRATLKFTNPPAIPRFFRHCTRLPLSP